MRNPFFRKFGPTIVLLAVGVLGSLGLYLASDTLFAIENIEVAGDFVEVVVNEDRLPKNLLFFPTDKLRQDLLLDNPLLSTLEFKKKFPHTLVIIATRKSPIARITMGELIGLVDRDGYIVGLDDETEQLPLISLDATSIAVGQKVDDPATRVALSLLASLPPEFKITKITRYDRLSIVAELPQTNIIVAQESDEASLSATLQTILTSFRIKGTMPTRIDLRYDKPVIEL